MGKITAISQIVDLFGSRVYLSSSEGVSDRTPAFQQKNNVV